MLNLSDDNNIYYEFIKKYKFDSFFINVTKQVEREKKFRKILDEK